MRSRKKAKLKINIPMAIVAAALCLVIFSAHFTSGLYARYTVKAGADDAARVAKFQVDLNFTTAETGETGTGASASAPGQLSAAQTSAQIEIDNSSEAAVRYTVVLEFAKDAQGRVIAPQLRVGTSGEVLSGVWSSDGTKLTFTQNSKNYTGTLAPGAEVDCLFSFTIGDGYIAAESVAARELTFSNDDIDSEEGSIPFVIRVSYVQVD